MNPALSEPESTSWIVSAYWYGKTRTLSSKQIITADTRGAAIYLARTGFAANASRVWAIECTPLVRMAHPDPKMRR